MELAYSINGTSNYQVIAKDVAPEVQRKIAQLNLGGMISYEATGSRVYPNGNIAGPEIGAASSTPDGIQARAGIELMMDKELSGTPGEYVYEAGAYGERIPETKSTVKEAINGKSVKTTLDLDTQWELQRAIDNGKDINGASYAYGVVERVKTGEVLAIAEDHAAQAGSDEVALYGSKVFGGAFEPGSTVKVLTVAGLIENNIAQPESQFYVADHYTTSNGQVISDAHNHSMARLTLAGIVGQSFNTGTTQASEPMTADQRYQLYHSFGLGEKTAVNFPGEADGVLHNVEDWDGRTLHNVLFGQGMSVSALQIVNSYATIANNGVNPVPTIISATKGEEDENWVPFPKPKQPFRVVSETTAKRTLGVLEASVTDGICASANMPNYRVGGKTGTAEMVGANGLSDTMMSFIGVFPLDNPEFVIGIFYKNPVKAQYSIATIPAFKEVAMFLTQKFGLPASTPAEYVPPSVW
jgi:cell division protein FtsI (penicillin-binding protein 3)